MRDVAIVAFAQSPLVRRQTDFDEPQMIMPVVREAYEQSGLDRSQIDFVCSGSADYLAGQPFAFIRGLDAVGAWPPLSESHVEMDGAWALYEAWMMLQIGHADTALVYGFGKASAGNMREVLTVELDPYYLAPTGIDCISTAGLQARALLDNSDYTERDMAEVAARSRRSAMSNDHAQVKKDVTAEEILAEPYWVDPLRPSDCPPITDGAAAVVLVAGDRARDLCERPAWIRGIDNRIETHYFGTRDLSKSPSTEVAGKTVGSGDGIEVAEISSTFSHQELILKDALGLQDSTEINPSGGPLAANPLMAVGLIRIGEAFNQIKNNGKQRVLAHATSGHCLQQNLVCVLEGD
ncbi:thiolase domain-containing protein [Acidimicrobiia bacterium EGI L10123]|uniref:thiolase domain-containing protein n=1 Tax=Salinilacustrithrix flava TaxID=2957203 RepID=UPI003D7C357F|nr:thiolase domain-containing protein [Acidimicrobiia bacterium EGI L10123]